MRTRDHFVFVSGGVFSDDLVERINALGVPCLEKPVSYGELFSAISARPMAGDGGPDQSGATASPTS